MYWQLLCCIAPRFLRIRMRLHHQSLHAKIQGPLCYFGHQIPPSCNVAGIANNGQIGHHAFQLQRNFPAGRISVGVGVVRGKSPVNGHQLSDSSGMYPLQGSQPKRQIWTNWVFYKNGHINAPQGIRNILNTERIYRRSCPYPKGFNPRFQRRFYMLCVGHFYHLL